MSDRAEKRNELAHELLSRPLVRMLRLREPPLSIAPFLLLLWKCFAGAGRKELQSFESSIEPALPGEECIAITQR